jgi:type IV fimbrial biogenesis protein FimT
LDGECHLLDSKKEWLMLSGPRSSRGFTLSEFMIGLAITGVLLAAAAPNVSMWISNMRVRNSADAIQNGLQLARTEAVRRNRMVELVLTNTSPTQANTNMVVEDVNGINWMVRQFQPAGIHTVDDYIQGREGNEGSEDVTVTATQGTIVFTGLGRLRSTALNPAVMAQIDVTNATTDRPLRLVIDTAGLIRMCDPSVSNPTDSRAC